MKTGVTTTQRGKTTSLMGKKKIKLILNMEHCSHCMFSLLPPGGFNFDEPSLWPQ